AAPLHLGSSRAAMDDRLRQLALGSELHRSEGERTGTGALHVEVRGPREEHPHRPYRAIRQMIAVAGLPTGAADLAQRAFALRARAEGKIHGISPDEVEFHEVGAIDSIVDVVGSALLVDALAPERVLALPP